MKMVVLDGYALNPGDLSWEGLSALGELAVYDRTETETLAVERIGDAEILIINKFPVTASLLDRCPSVQVIFVLATGYNVVDCAAARARGIPVCNVPAYGTTAVAQFTMGLILTLCHRIELHSHSVKQMDWTSGVDFCYWLTPQTELSGKTLGIIGFGRIGREVGKIAKAFGMQVLAYSRSECEEGRAVADYVPLDELLTRSDIISLHCPMTPETENIIRQETIAKMKDGAMLINTARGQLVNDADLAEALNSGKLRGAALDVVSVEPILPDNPLLRCENCILTPHIAWAPVESRRRLMNIVVENVRCWLNGEPKNVVN